MSTFVSHLNHELSLKLLTPSSTAPLPPSPTPGGIQAAQSQNEISSPETEAIEALRDYFLHLSPPYTLPAARQCVGEIQKFDDVLRIVHAETLSAGEQGKSALDAETVALRRAILGKVVLGVYVQTLNTFLDEASSADTELEWWGDVARSRWNVALYLLQSQ